MDPRPADSNSTIWSGPAEHFFRDRHFKPRRQKGPHCVSASLAAIADATQADFQDLVNTQDPVSWSCALAPHGMKLAYCPSDSRRISHYIDELLRLDDLFTLSFYTPADPGLILGEPDQRGWICGSHVVVLHRDRILDSASGRCVDAREFVASRAGKHTKRIFRVVPSGHARGL